MPVFEPIFQTLSAAGVRYVLVGGLATLLHGYARLTADVDFGCRSRSGKSQKNDSCVEGEKVDLSMKPEAPFDELLTRSQEAFVGKTRVRIASLDDLILLKQHAGRPQDLTDLEQLEAIRRQKGNRRYG